MLKPQGNLVDVPPRNHGNEVNVLLVCNEPLTVKYFYISHMTRAPVRDLN